MKKEEIIELTEILDNVTYWDTCPEDYKVRIKYLIAQLKQEEPSEEEKCEHYWVNQKTASEIIVTTLQLCVKCKHIRTATKEELCNPNKSVT